MQERPDADGISASDVQHSTRMPDQVFGIGRGEVGQIFRSTLALGLHCPDGQRYHSLSPDQSPSRLNFSKRPPSRAGKPPTDKPLCIVG